MSKGIFGPRDTVRLIANWAAFDVVFFWVRCF